MDMKSAAPKGVLCLRGFPNPAEWQRDVLAEVWPLEAGWTLKLGPVTEGATARRRPSLGLELLYRTLDRLLFGRSLRRAGDLNILSRLEAAAAEPGSLHLAYSARRAAEEAVARGESVLYVEFEGRQMADLEEAVRMRLGVLEATLNAQVWMVEPSRQKRLLFQGQLDMDHRSLCKSIALCAAKLPALLRGALARIDHPGTAPQAPLPVASASQALTAGSQLLRLGKAIARRALWRSQWQIEAYSYNEAHDAAHGERRNWLRPPADSFWADPFLMHVDGRVWLLFEELPYSTNKGHISIVELDRDGKPKSAPRMVLSEPWHLSYPFIFQHDGATYMLPEAEASRELRLYRCEDPSNPVHWKHCATLLSGQRVADSTIVEFEGRLWMFCTHGDDDASMDDTLHIYWADHVTGPWHAHRLNPVKIDAQLARAAGNMWVRDGVLHRVVQNCATTYGGSTLCTRVTVLNETDFEEEVVRDWTGSAVRSSEPWHTYNRHEDLLVLDRLRRAPRWTRHR